MLVLFLCKRTCIDHFQEHVIRYVYMFKDPDPVLIMELAIGIGHGAQGLGRLRGALMTFWYVSIMLGHVAIGRHACGIDKVA
jgi:hypothetical protein